MSDKTMSGLHFFHDALHSTCDYCNTREASWRLRGTWKVGITSDFCDGCLLELMRQAYDRSPDGYRPGIKAWMRKLVGDFREDIARHEGATVLHDRTHGLNPKGIVIKVPVAEVGKLLAKALGPLFPGMLEDAELTSIQQLITNHDVVSLDFKFPQPKKDPF